MRTKLKPIAAASSLALATFAGQAGAVEKSWACSTWFWAEPSCWTPTGGPTSGDNVLIAPVNGYDAVVTIENYTQTTLGGGGAVAAMLTIDSNPLSGKKATLIQSSSTLVTGSEFVGRDGIGFFDQSGGNNSTQTLKLGYGSASNGSYKLSSGNLTGDYELLGVSGKATFTQSGGTNTITNVMTLGAEPGSESYYRLSAGTLTNNLLIVGQSGWAEFSQMGGSHDAASLALGTQLGGIGRYFLTGGTLNVSGDITSGTGTGYLIISGGTLNVGSGNIAVSSFLLGEAGIANYTQTKGAVSADIMVVGDYFDSTYQLNGGSLTVQQKLIVGGQGSGSFSQLAGSNTVTANLLLGGAISRIGTYTMSGGTLNVGGAITTGDGTGVLNLDGGVLTVGSGNIGVTNLNLGAVAGSSGSYVQTIGTVGVGNLVLGTAGSTASYTLAGGVLNIGSSLTSGGQSVLNLDGGSFTAPASATLVELVLGSAAGSGFTLNIATGGGANTFATLSAATETIGGLGVGQVFQTGGSNTVGTLTINDTYTFTGGSLTVTGSLTNNGTFQLGGATLTNAGTTDNNGALAGRGRIISGGAFTNNGLVSQSGGPLTLAGSGAYINNGNWDLFGGGQLRLEGTSFSNAGSLNLNGGLVTGTGSLVNKAGGTISGRGLIGTSFSNAGRLALADGTTTVSQSFVNSGLIQLSNNTASLNGGDITNTGLIQGYGQIVNKVINTGSIQASGGTLALTRTSDNSGTLVADNASTLLFLGGLSANSGNIRIDGGTLNNTDHTLNNSGQILAGTGASRLYGSLTGLAGSKLIVSGGGSLSLYNTVDIQSGAELRVSAGATATFFGQVYQRTGSAFTGTGTKFYEAGYSPGSSPGFAVDEGNVNFGVGNLYLAEIGGTSACTADCATNDALKNGSFDKYFVAGNLGVGGTLKLASWNGFVAQAGQSFDLMDWGTVSGNFSSIDASGLLLAAGTQLDTSRLYTDGVIGVTPVPEPGIWATMLAGLVCLAAFSSRVKPARRHS